MNRILTTQGWLVLILILSFIGLGVFGFIVLTKERSVVFESDQVENTLPPVAEDTALEETNTTDTQTQDSARVMAPEEISLLIGETKTFSDLKITFKEIVSDSRCPVDVQCIQAGTAVVKSTFKISDGEDVEKELTLGKDPIILKNYSVSFIKLDPEKNSKSETEELKYKATFLVSPLAKGDNI